MLDSSLVRWTLTGLIGTEDQETRRPEDQKTRRPEDKTLNMISTEIIETLKNKVYKELTGNILPFWMNNAIDHKFGGFIGQINGSGKIIPDADKGGILNARILWTFSASYNKLKNPEYLRLAERSMNYIKAHFFDEKFGGTYWKVTFDGKPADTKKQIYSQAFFIYALSEFYKASGSKESIEKAMSLFHLIEDYSFDQRLNGYLEAYSREWQILSDLRLSDKDANEKKTTNTHLHILEAYTNLYKVLKNPEIGKKLRNLVILFLDKIIDPVSGHLLLFFDENWNSRSSLVSYGHDIEASWLVYDAALTLNDRSLIEKAKPVCIKLAIASLEGLQADGSMIYEKNESEGKTDFDRHWWPQAETIVGLINLYQITEKEEYFQKALSCWKFIEENIIDRKNGEWFWSIKADGTPNINDDKAGFWKCPYHNARACLEVIAR